MKTIHQALKPLLFLSLFFTLSFVALAQTNGKLSTQQLAEDFDVFKNSIQDIHPGLYWYNDSSQVQVGFAKIEQAIAQNMSQREFYALLQEFYASIGCGHSWMQTPSDWQLAFDSKSYRLPLTIFFEDSLFTVFHDLTPEKSIPRGATITALNGEPFQQVFDGLLKYAISDGYNLTKRRSMVASNFSRFYQSFYRSDSTFEISYRLPGKNTVNTMTVKGITKAERSTLKTERYGQSTSRWDAPLAKFEVMENGVGYLDLNTFSRGWLKSNKINYKKLLKKTFAQLKEDKVDKLVLDLRGNGGGSDVFGAILCQYLMEEDFEYFDRMETVTSKFNYKDYSDTKGFNTIGILFKKDKEKPGFYTFNYHKPLATQKSRKNAFSGQLIVLTDGETFSTSADVASVLHYNQRATFIGREVGGGYHGNNSALQYQIKLPNSKVTYYIPVIRYYTAVSNPELIGRGVKPDIVVKETFEDRIKGRDAALEKALSTFK